MTWARHRRICDRQRRPRNHAGFLTSAVATLSSGPSGAGWRPLNSLVKCPLPIPVFGRLQIVVPKVSPLFRRSLGESFAGSGPFV